jgi:hypothetical protein
MSSDNAMNKTQMQIFKPDPTVIGARRLGPILPTYYSYGCRHFKCWYVIHFMKNFIVFLRKNVVLIFDMPATVIEVRLER